MFDKLKEKLTNYIDARLKLYQHNITDKVVKICIRAFILFLVYTSLMGAIFFWTIALSIVLNKYLESYYLGYLITSSLYFLVFVFILLTRNGRFWKRLKDKIVEKLTE